MPLGVGPATIQREDERERVRSDQSGDGRARRGVPDDQRRGARGRHRDRRPRPPRVVARDDDRGARGARSARRRAARRSAARSSRRSSCGRWGSPSSRRSARWTSAPAIYEYYATEATSLLADEPITLSDGEGSAFVRRSSVGVLLGIMPWNYPYYQVARFAGPNLVVGNTILLKHAPQCPESAAAIAADLRRRRLPCRRVHEHLRHQRPGRGRHRRPAGAGRVGHRLGARGRGGGRDRGAEPEEGRARARRLGPVHPAQHRRPRQRRRVGRRGAARERRPGVQRRQALRRRLRSLRAVRGQADGGADRGRAHGSLVAGRGDGPALVGDGGRPPRRPAAAGRGGRRDARRRHAATGTSSRPAC